MTHKLAGLVVGGYPIMWYIADVYHVLLKGELSPSAWYYLTPDAPIGKDALA